MVTVGDTDSHFWETILCHCGTIYPLSIMSWKKEQMKMYTYSNQRSKQLINFSTYRNGYDLVSLTENELKCCMVVVEIHPQYILLSANRWLKVLLKLWHVRQRVTCIQGMLLSFETAVKQNPVMLFLWPYFFINLNP